MTESQVPQGVALIRKAAIYGAVTGVAVFAVGWITGMGGGLFPNLIFGALMGTFASLCFVLAVHFGSRNRK